MRICSLLPSSTEIVYALGLGDQLVAVTHECDHPSEASRLPRVTRSLIDHSSSTSGEINRHVAEAVHGGSSIYALDQHELERLNPDLILTQELCEVCAVSYGEVRKAVRMLPGDRKVLSLEPTSLGGILDSITEVGVVTGTERRAKEVVASLRRRIEHVTTKAAKARSKPKVFAMEWLDPLFVGGHWVPEMIRLAGGVDGLGRENRPSFIVEWKDIAAYAPDVVVVMPCGYDLARTQDKLREVRLPEAWHALPAVRHGRVYAVDGSGYFNRPGPRIVDGLEIMAEILHPDLFPRKHDKNWAQVT
ncbi:MAG: cobalamin-binding protein [Chloroflexi bacterium]|nr:cobalamin-binding protein [Chloroflexota bacterium]